MAKTIIDKLEEAHIVGRGGAGFPAHLKWRFTKKATGKPKYVVCNASEGEPLVSKDFYILKNHPEKVFLGMKLAMDYLKTKEAYFNIQAPYYKKLKKSLDALVSEYEKKGYHFRIFEEHPSYIGGEETALLNAIEGKRIQPRIKPPFPADAGLFGKPTLVHNVETLFDIALVHEGAFEHRQFISIVDLKKKEKILHLKEDLTVLEILQQTKTLPKTDFFVQVWGGASGLILNSKQIATTKMKGFGSVILYPADVNTRDLLLQWFEFYKDESCGKCTPCREGTYQLYKLVKSKKKIDWKEIFSILEPMEETSFCALGKSVAVPVRSYYKNIFSKKIIYQV